MSRETEDRNKILLIDHPVGQRDDRASRRLVELGFDVEWRRPAAGDALPEPDGSFRAAIIYGGPESVNKTDEFGYLLEEMRWLERWVAEDQPFLGICLGGQMLARVLGADVNPHPEGLFEIGYVEIQPTEDGDGFLSGPLNVYHWHNEGFACPQTADLLAKGPTFENQAYRYGQNAYGIQFHPEVSISVMKRWMREADHCLKEPGAHPPERQLADAELYDHMMADWLDHFFATWLGSSQSED